MKIMRNPCHSYPLVQTDDTVQCTYYQIILGKEMWNNNNLKLNFISMKI